MHLPWKNTKTMPKVAVIGDIMLDEYLDGRVSRISPEAPVPVHLVSTVTHRAGGAANTALNIARVGAKALLFGVCGNDSAAADLKNLLKRDGIGFENVVVDQDRPTIKKTRVSASRQQIVRVDWEKLQPISSDVEEGLLGKLALAQFDAILVSDYGKGGLTSAFLEQLFALATQRQAPVVVDPKGVDFGRYRGSAVITPNRSEACLALGLDPAESHDREFLAAQLRETFGLADVLVTLGAEGMYLLTERGEKVYLPAHAREVFDVSGAGDTVAAMFALCRAVKTKPETSMRIANAAASVVVGKWGTHPIEEPELEEALAQIEQHGSRKILESQAKIRNQEAVLDAIGAIKARSRSVVFTNGCFDLLHAGHVSYLEKSRALGDLLIVGVNSDASVRRLKGDERPVVGLEDRMQVLAALGCVDYVVSFDQDTPLDLINYLQPNVIVKGADWEKSEIVGGLEVLALGGSVETIELIEGLSTSTIIERIRSNRGVKL